MRDPAWVAARKGRGRVSDRSRAEAVKDRVEGDLLAYAGVTGVATGPKIVQGTPTDVWAIRVYVEHKRDVPPDQALPTEIEGVPVDVVEAKFIPHSGGTDPDRPTNG